MLFRSLRSPDLFAFGVWCQLGPPYLGHILFEKTHRSIDQNWLFAAMGSWWTTLQIFAGRQRVSEPPALPTTSAPGRRRDLLPFLKEHGRNLHSFMVLEPGLEQWVEGNAAVAYADRGGRWVAAGSPLCAAEAAGAVSARFAEEARKAGRQAVFFAVSDRFASRLDASWDRLPIGRVPTWRPEQWEGAIRTSPKLRNRLRKAARDGLRVRQVAASELAEGAPLRSSVERLARAWAGGRALPPMGFMVTLDLFTNLDERRIFLVEAEGEVRAVAFCVPIYGRNGWLVEDLLTADAPAGAVEALIDAVMRAAERERITLVSLGLVAFSGIEGPGHPVLTGLLRLCARTRSLYDFAGILRFREKLRPTEWETVYLVADRRIGFLTLRAVAMAFAEGWVPRYAWRAVVRWFHAALDERMPRSAADDGCPMCVAKRAMAAVTR